MAKLVTLTVPDVLWVNLQLTKVSQEYSFGRLEEATFYQYGYGESVDLVGQAARTLEGFERLRPLSAGNRATALVTVLAFLECNGKPLTLDPADAAAWARAFWADPAAGEGKMAAAISDEHVHLHHGVPDKRAVVFAILEKYQAALADLMSDEPVVALR